jgi:hypothetical protein
MIKYSIILFFCFFFTAANAQKPKNGTYTYSIAFEEWGGKSLGATSTVLIKGDSIKIIHNGKGNLSGNKDDIIDEGIIMKHKKTGKWIIGHQSKDVYAEEIGGWVPDLPS